MPPTSLRELILQARRELNLWTAESLAQFLGTTSRTMRRHRQMTGVVTADGHARLIHALYPKNPQLAEQLAQAVGTSCAALGLEPVGAPSSPSSSVGEATAAHAALVVCAAADALNLPPRDVRPALATVFGLAHSLRVDLDGLAKLLSEAPSTRRKSSTPARRDP